MNYTDYNIDYHIDKVIHMADIHIPQKVTREIRYKYTYVFDKTIEAIKDITKNNKCLIVIAGDLFDIKNTLSPESIYLSKYLLIGLANLSPVIIITGNHDCNEKNTQKMDTIYSIVSNPTTEDLKNVYYLRFSGVYRFGQILFGVSSLLDKKFVKYKDIDRQQIENSMVYALYHGDIKGSVGFDGVSWTDYDQETETTRYRKQSEFDGYDHVILGDIHKEQVFGSGRFSYSGSLLQVNRGEPPVGHGFRVLDTTTNISEFVEIIGDQLSVKIRNNEDIDKYRHISDKNIIAIVENKDLIERLPFKNVKIQNRTKIERKYISKTEENIKNIESLLRARSTKPDDILKIHSKIFKNIQQNFGNYWFIESLEFKNVFVYDSDVVHRINFDKGVVAVVGNNASGKSSILNAVTACLFSKPSKYVLNSNSNSGYIQVKLNINDETYVVNKKFTRRKTAKTVKTSLIFTKGDENLTGNRSIYTQKIISEYIGDYDDFALLNTKENKMNKTFTTMTRTERHKYISMVCGVEQIQQAEKDARNMKRMIDREIDISTGVIQNIKVNIRDDIVEIMDKYDNNSKRLVDITKKLYDLNNIKDELLKNQPSIQRPQGRVRCDITQGQYKDMLSILENVKEKYISETNVSDTIYCLLLDSVKTLDNIVDHGYEELCDISDMIVPAANGAEFKEDIYKVQDGPFKTFVLNYRDIHIHIEKARRLRKCLDEISSLPTDIHDKNLMFCPEYINIDHYGESIYDIKLVPFFLDNIITFPETINRLVRYIAAYKYKEETETKISELSNKLLSLENEMSEWVDDGYGDEIVSVPKRKKKRHTKTGDVSLKDIYDTLLSIDRSKETAVVPTKLIGDILVVLSDTDAAYNRDVDMHNKMVDDIIKHNKNLEKHRIHERKIKDIREKIVKHRESIENIEIDKKYIEKIIDISMFSGIKARLCDVSGVVYTAEQIIELDDAINKSRDIAYLYECCLNGDLCSINGYINNSKREVAMKHNESVEKYLRRVELQREIDDIKEFLCCEPDNLDISVIMDDARRYNKPIFIEMVDRYMDIEWKEKIINEAKEAEVYNKKLKSALYHLKLLFDMYKEPQRIASEYENAIGINHAYEYWNKYDTCVLDIKRYGEERDSLIEEQTSTKNTIDNHERNIKLLAKEQKILEKHKKKSDIIEEYIFLVSKKGIQSNMVISSIDAIINEANKMFIEYTKKTIKHKSQNGYIEIYVENEGSICDISTLSGYESLVLDISIKKAISHINKKNICTYFAIDEALDCMDEINYRQRLPDIIKILESCYRDVLIISHRDISPECIDKSISISNKMLNIV